MNTPIRGDAPDLIATALYRLGYRPRDSILLLGLRAVPGGYVETTAVRTDLVEAEHRAGMARHLADAMARCGASAVFGAVFSDEPRYRVRAVGRALHDALDAVGLEVLDFFQVVGDHYRGVDCRDRACCPHPGRPFAEVLDSAAAASHVALGRSLVESEEALIADVRVASPSDEPADRRRRYTGQVRARPSTEQMLARWFEALDDEAVVLEEGFADGLEEVRLRDALLLYVSGGSRRQAVRFLHDASAVDGFMSAQPDRRLCARAQQLLAAAARECSEDGRAEALAVMAWVAWWEGCGARSRMLLGELFRTRPDHGLGGLVGVALSRGMPPPWVTSPTAVLAGGGALGRSGGRR